MPASHPGRTLLPHRSKLFKSHSSNEWLTSIGELALSLLHGDGSNTVAKKGGTKLATAATNTRRARK